MDQRALAAFEQSQNNAKKIDKVQGGLISNVRASYSGPRGSTFIIQLVFDVKTAKQDDAFSLDVTIDTQDTNAKELYCLFYTNDNASLGTTDGNLNETSRTPIVLSEQTYTFNGIFGNTARYLHAFVCVVLNESEQKTDITIKGAPVITYQNYTYTYDNPLSLSNLYSQAPGDQVLGYDSNIVRITQLKEQMEFTSKGKDYFNPLYGKKWNALGDSLTNGHTLPQSATYPTVIGARNNMTFRNYGLNGTWLASSAGNSMVSRYPTMVDDADYVTVFGGTNDYNGMSLGNNDDNTHETFKGSLNIMCSGLITKYPKAKIGFITPYHFTDDLNGNGNSVLDYVDAIIKICSKYGIPVLDNYRSGGLLPINAAQRSALMLDNLHPTAEGHQFISSKIEAFLKSL